MRLVDLIYELTKEGYTIIFGTEFRPPKDMVPISLTKDGVHHWVLLAMHHFDDAIVTEEGESNLVSMLKNLLVDKVRRDFKEDKIYINEADALDR